ncbi:MAG: rod-binding protein [Thermogutta sp.]
MTSIRAVSNSNAAMLRQVDFASQAKGSADGGFEVVLSGQAAALRKSQSSALPRGAEAFRDNGRADAVNDASSPEDDGEVRKAFQSFVGQTLFGMMLQEMRKSVHKTPYFHGGTAEEVFQQQLDTVLSEKLADAAGDRFSNPMYELFQLRTKGR